MPERFEIYIAYKRRYINTLPFLFLLPIAVGTGMARDGSGPITFFEVGA